MTSPYPILTKRDLQNVPKRGILGLGRKVRQDLVKAGAHHALVYKTDRGLVADYGQLHADDDLVVRATHVCLVDMGRDVPVTIQLDIPSAEASDFAVGVTFACTVTDAVRAVRENLDAQTALRHYLLNHHKIFQLGLPYKMLQISQVRIDVAAQITAYTTLRPPVISGLEVRMTSVQVSTPAELIKFEEARRKQLLDHVVSYEGIDLAHRREDLEVEYKRTLELDGQRHAQTIQTRAQRGQHELAREQARFAREELDEAADAIGHDPHRALLHAHAQGQMSARELADVMRGDVAAEADYSRTLSEQMRLEARRDRDLDRSERRRDQHDEREERRREEQIRREDELDHRTYERQRSAEVREDNNRRRELDREDKRLEREQQRRAEEAVKTRQLQVLQFLKESGQLQMVDVNVQRIMAEVIGVDVKDLEPPAVSYREKSPELGSDKDADGGTIDADSWEEHSQ